jgi:digeranylgeranylglycerophospholipid reductase
MHPLDVAVVGSGPAGSYTALNLAKLGVKATVFEEHPQVGLPSHCAGHISIRSLKGIGLYPLPAGVVENTFCTANFYSPTGTKFSLNLSSPVTVALDRVKFDQYLAKLAQEAGATFALGTSVQSLVITDGWVKGINIKRSDGTKECLDSRIVVDCEGISSRLLRQTGLQPFKPSGLLYAIETEMDEVQDVEQDAVEVYFGKAYAPGFYGWLIPRRDGTAKVGLATNRGNPRDFLKRLMTKHPVASKQLSKAQITKIGNHTITVGGPIQRTYADGFLAVGDCASQVKPTTGGGVIFGLTCAKAAANIANQAIEQNDVSANFLSAYQKLCDDLLKFDVNVMLRLRRFFNSLSDERLDEMLKVCGKLGVDKALRDADEIDFQGKLLLSAMGKPAIAAALAYFMVLYLSANP